MSAPSIVVGAGGSGAKAEQPGQLSPEPKQSLSNEVGDMAEATQTSTDSANSVSEGMLQGTTLRERSSDEPPNPRKRMWEENTGPAAAGEARQRDEL